MPLHDDEVEIGTDALRRMLAAHHPELAELPLRRVRPGGTDNLIVRIGRHLAVRVPRRRAADAEDRLRREGAASAELATVCPVPVPVRRCVHPPTGGGPAWALDTWVGGSPATPSGLAGSDRFASDLAGLLGAIVAAPTGGRRFAGTGRGGRIADSSAWVERSLRESEGLVDVPALRDRWRRWRELEPATRDAMTHGDLIPANLLVRRDRLVGVLDAGGSAPADPALDLVSVWHLLDADRRAAVRAALDIDGSTWRRGAAWAFVQAVGLVWYYRSSHPPMAELGRSTLERVLADDAV